MARLCCSVDNSENCALNPPESSRAWKSKNSISCWPLCPIHFPGGKTQCFRLTPFSVISHSLVVPFLTTFYIWHPSCKELSLWFYQKSHKVFLLNTTLWDFSVPIYKISSIPPTFYVFFLNLAWWYGIHKNFLECYIIFIEHQLDSEQFKNTVNNLKIWNTDYPPSLYSQSSI